ncbi:carbohydrate esterase family 16 protein [Mycena filopes]|nr:carbohydrate esterase family 16 protein [Mycena filopes]
MFPLLSSTVLALLCATSSAVVLPRTTAGAVQLAVSPQCGSLSGGPADVNAGLGALSSYKTIVAFGDSFTGGKSNGATWAQALADSAGATLINHGSNGAVVDVNQWPQVATVQSASKADYIHQVETFMTYGNTMPDPDTTLYVIFFGIGDYAQAVAAGHTDMVQIAGVQVYTTLEMVSARAFAKNILVVDNYGLGKTSGMGDTYKQDIFTSLATSRRLYGMNVGFASFNSIWEGVLYGAPGAAAFGYTNTGVCVQNGQTCQDPDHTMYWSAGTPSAATHSIMAEYVEQVLTKCQSS